jgi:hypothetical protein
MMAEKHDPKDWVREYRRVGLFALPIPVVIENLKEKSAGLDDPKLVHDRLCSSPNKVVGWRPKTEKDREKERLEAEREKRRKDEAKQWELREQERRDRWLKADILSKTKLAIAALEGAGYTVTKAKKKAQDE